MEVYIGIAVICFLLGFFVGGGLLVGATERPLKNELHWERMQKRRDQKLFIDTLARTYAQILLPRCPDRLLTLSNEIGDQIEAMCGMSDTELQRLMQEIAERNPLIADFDKMQLHDFAAYEDNSAFLPTLEELLNAYRDCKLYSLYLDGDFQENRVRASADIFAKYRKDHDETQTRLVREHKDEALLARSILAMNELKAVNSEKQRIFEKLELKDPSEKLRLSMRYDDKELIYKGSNFEVHYVPNVVEHVTGIRFLDTDECVVKRVFAGETIHTFWCRADDQFDDSTISGATLHSPRSGFVSLPFSQLSSSHVLSLTDEF